MRVYVKGKIKTRQVNIDVIGLGYVVTSCGGICKGMV
jgi:hypothetical protein